MIPSKLYSVEERAQVWEDAGRMCHYCDKVLPRPGTKAGRRTQLDHKHSSSSGGLHDLSNLLVCCRPCNLKKGKKSYEEFLRWQLLESRRTIRRVSKLLARLNHGKTEME